VSRSVIATGALARIDFVRLKPRTSTRFNSGSYAHKRFLKTQYFSMFKEPWSPMAILSYVAGDGSMSKTRKTQSDSMFDTKPTCLEHVVAFFYEHAAPPGQEPDSAVYIIPLRRALAAGLRPA
jgi:hypothetical protein